MESIGKLRNIRTEEVDLMRSWRNAPAVRMNMYTRHEISSEEHAAWWAHAQQREDQQYFIFEINDVPMGVVSFTKIDALNRNAEWAFYTAPEALRGTGTKMEYLALEHAFNILNLHKLNCEVLAFNEAVIKLHQKYGFKVEGVLREQHKFEDRFIDIYCLGILRSEWAEKSSLMLEKLRVRSKG
jgi:UDP-4-amino-4,6-dideoxy-N-acetyl-beta-L-altrosamine N-acetyltransferase